MRVQLNDSAIRNLEQDERLAQQLRPTAENILGRARSKAPHWIQAAWFVRTGVGPRGAFSQAVARGSGTILAEYGGRNSPAYAYMRSSAR